MRGYKTFDYDFEIGKTYTLNRRQSEFHFYRTPVSIRLTPTIRVAEIETVDEGRSITIIREIPHEEFITMCTGQFTMQDGTVTQWLNGELHAVDGPAIKCKDGTEWYYSRGKPYRKDGPAFIDSSGYKMWYHDGKYHHADPRKLN